MEIPWTRASSDIRNEKESQVLFCVRRKDMTSHVRIYFRSTMIIRPKHIHSTLQVIPSVLPGLFPRSQIFSENAFASLKWKMLGLRCPIQRRTLLRHQKHLRLCLRMGSRDLWQSYSQWTSLGLRVGLGSSETSLHLTLRDLVQWMTLRFAFLFPWEKCCFAACAVPLDSPLHKLHLYRTDSYWFSQLFSSFIFLRSLCWSPFTALSPFPSYCVCYSIIPKAWQMLWA